MSDQYPDVRARLVSPAFPDENWTFRVTDCPFCGRTHIHGAGPTVADAHTCYGTRVSHCQDQRKRDVYRLVPAAMRGEGQK